MWNNYNRVKRAIGVIDTTDSWSYTTDTWRQGNAASGNKVEYVVGLQEDAVFAKIVSSIILTTNSSVGAKTAIGVDSTTSPSGVRGFAYNANGSPVGNQMVGFYEGFPGLGYHYLAWIEKGADGTTSSFRGDDAATGVQSGMIATIMN